jgi:hypothetical protein
VHHQLVEALQRGPVRDGQQRDARSHARLVQLHLAVSGHLWHGRRAQKGANRQVLSSSAIFGFSLLCRVHGSKVERRFSEPLAAIHQPNHAAAKELQVISKLLP